MAWYRTDWHIVASRGGETTVGEIVNFGATNGEFLIENKNTRVKLKLSYDAGGYGIGYGSPINVSVWGPGLRGPSINTSILARDRRTLYSDDFEGICYIISIQGSARIGQSACEVYFNVPMIYAALGLTAAGPAILPVLTNQARAVGAIVGPTFGPQAGFSAMIYFGNVTVHN